MLIKHNRHKLSFQITFHFYSKKKLTFFYIDKILQSTFDESDSYNINDKYDDFEIPVEDEDLKDDTLTLKVAEILNQLPDI